MGCFSGDRVFRVNKSISFFEFDLVLFINIWIFWRNICYFMNWLVVSKYKWSVFMMKYLW